ncbi:MAG: BON domain-containing protein [Phycisphaerae bacterium]
MIRSLFALACLGLLGLFAFFYFNDGSGRAAKERALDAARHVGDTVKDEGIALAVRTRITSVFGFEAGRFLQVYYNDGRVLVYGLVPPEVTAEALAADVRRVPGVQDVEVLVHARPAYVTPLKPTDATPATDAAPADKPG